MTTQPAMTLEVRLSPPTLPRPVDVTLRSFGDRWVAVADAGGTRTIGLGTRAGQALAASLAPLGDRVRTLLMADPALLAASAELAGQAAG
jgi:hypothetical protein